MCCQRPASICGRRARCLDRQSDLATNNDLSSPTCPPLSHLSSAFANGNDTNHPHGEQVKVFAFLVGGVLLHHRFTSEDSVVTRYRVRVSLEAYAKIDSAAELMAA